MESKFSFFFATFFASNSLDNWMETQLVLCIVIKLEKQNFPNSTVHIGHLYICRSGKVHLFSVTSENVYK